MVSLGFIVLGWFSCNTAFGIAVKQGYRCTHDALALTTLQMLVAGLFALLLATPGILQQHAAPFIARPRQVLCSSALLLAGTLCTNLSMTILSVAFTHTVKCAEPLFTVLILYMWYAELPSCSTIASMVAIISGLVVASSAEASFDWTGFEMGMASNAFLQSRNVLNKDLLGRAALADERPGSAPMLLALTLIAAAPLQLLLHLLVRAVSGSPLWPERDPSSHCAHAYTRILEIPLAFCGYHIFSILVLSRVHPVVHALLNALKRGVVIGVSATVLGESKPPLWQAGMLLALLGVLFSGVSKHVLTNGAQSLLRVSTYLLSALAVSLAAAVWACNPGTVAHTQLHVCTGIAELAASQSSKVPSQGSSGSSGHSRTSNSVPLSSSQLPASLMQVLHSVGCDNTCTHDAAVWCASNNATAKWCSRTTKASSELRHHRGRSPSPALLSHRQRAQKDQFTALSLPSPHLRGKTKSQLLDFVNAVRIDAPGRSALLQELEAMLAPGRVGGVHLHRPLQLQRGVL